MADVTEGRDAEIARLREALGRLRPIIENSRAAFEDPLEYDDPSLRAYRLEGLASGCRVGLEVIDKVLVAPVSG